MYRDLGANESNNTTLYEMPVRESPVNNLPHSEGTTLTKGTVMSIGSGSIKLLRDYACKGVTVGKNLGDPSMEPHMLKRGNCHTMAYDIEKEFYGKKHPSFRGRMLCTSLVCSCGFMETFSICDVYGIKGTVTVCKNNEDMAIRVINSIIGHAPIFLVGHNCYSYDNIVLGTMLPKGHKFRDFFTPTFHKVKSYGNMGLILELPGINNFDTYRYITKAMEHDFRGFSLSAIADQLELKSKKITDHRMEFSEAWYTRCDANAHSMCAYNIRDCEVALNICWKLDIFNKVINMCYATNCCIPDALIYSTGAISVSTLCSKAHEIGSKYIWTRCDWHPDTIKGGLVWFRGKISCPRVCVVDFTSMYPNIVKCCRVSPESVDFYDLGGEGDIRFTQLEFHVCYMLSEYGLCLAIVLFGLRQCAIQSCTFSCQIGLHSEVISLDDYTPEHLSKRILQVMKSWLRRDRYLLVLDFIVLDLSIVPVNIKIPNKSSTSRVHKSMNKYSSMLCHHCLSQCSKERVDVPCYESLWIPSSYNHKENAVDWYVSPLGSECIFCTKESIVRHPVSLNLAGVACDSLMRQRQKIKLEIESLKRIGGSKDLISVKDNSQWALKIAANSLYGCLAFRSYNTYSPRCAASITGIGRWSVTMASVCIKSLGCIPIYGDTDSVMFTIPHKCPRNYIKRGRRSLCLLPRIVSNISLALKMQGLICTYSIDQRRQIALDVLCGRSSLDMFNESNRRHIAPFNGIVVKVINYILKFTPLDTLNLSFEYPKNNTKGTYDNFVVFSSKHYMAMSSGVTMLQKGVPSIRRVGSVVGNLSLKRLSDVVLSNNSLMVKRREMSMIYRIIRSRIISMEEITLYGVTQTVHGITRDSVRVKKSRSKPPEFVPLPEAIVKQVFVPYYMEILDKTYYDLEECLVETPTDIHIDRFML